MIWRLEDKNLLIKDETVRKISKNNKKRKHLMKKLIIVIEQKNINWKEFKCVRWLVNKIAKIIFNLIQKSVFRYKKRKNGISGWDWGCYEKLCNFIGIETEENFRHKTFHWNLLWNFLNVILCLLKIRKKFCGASFIPAPLPTGKLKIIVN